MKRSALRNVCIGMLACSAMMAVPANAILGIGLHYGMDFTLNMSDKLNDPAVFDSLQLRVSSFTGTLPGTFTNPTIKGSDLPIYIDRSKWERTPYNFGGKIYIDVIPFIDAVEVSGNFGVWEYFSQLRYPTSIQWKAVQPADPNAPFKDRVDVVYDSTQLTLKNFGIGYFGLDNTPYAKLQLDLTVRKFLLRFPKTLKVINIYAGGGFTTVFATPVVSAALIKKALGDNLNKVYTVDTLSNNVFGDVDMMKSIGTEILKELFTPHYDLNILVGAMVKIPVIPIGVYVDGKLLIPLGKPDPAVDLGGLGFLVNAGIALAF
jgi:hypothetical protein